MVYPKIAELNYKDKHIDIKIPIRVKLIKLDIYGCSNKDCKLYEDNGTIKDFERYIKIHNLDDKGSKRINRRWVSKSLLNENNEYICPKCQSKLINSKKNLFKCYITLRPKYINVCSILRANTSLNWKENSFNYPPWNAIESYETTIKDIYEYIKGDRYKNIKILKDDITEKELEKLYKERQKVSEKNKVVRKLTNKTRFWDE